MKRIYKHGDTQNTSLIPDKEPNILIYWTPSCAVICRSYALLKMVRFLGPACTCKDASILGILLHCSPCVSLIVNYVSTSWFRRDPCLFLVYRVFGIVAELTTNSGNNLLTSEAESNYVNVAANNSLTSLSIDDGMSTEGSSQRMTQEASSSQPPVLGKLRLPINLL